EITPTVTAVFYEDDNHRHLHSFPTRRSSDLVEHAGDLRGGEEQIAELAPRALLVAGGESGADLAHFLFDLVEDRFDVGPVESGARRAPADLFRAHHRRHPGRHAVERAARALPRALVPLYRLPRRDDAFPAVD